MMNDAVIFLKQIALSKIDYKKGILQNILRNMTVLRESFFSKSNLIFFNTVKFFYK